MSLTGQNKFENIFPACRSKVEVDVWNKIISACGDNSPETFVSVISTSDSNPGIPQYLPDLARIEIGLNETRSKNPDFPLNISTNDINPTFQLIQVGWQNLTALLSPENQLHDSEIIAGKEHIMLWRDPVNGRVKYDIATDKDLLALKIIAEGRDTRDIAQEEAIGLGEIDNIINRASEKGILLKPSSRIQRSAAFNEYATDYKNYLTSSSFAIQWHITQACDLNCKHCYDRSDRSPMKYDKALSVLDDLYDFCKQMSVKGQVIFTGGNPLLYPKFMALYEAAVERGFLVAILGNPAKKRKIEDIIKISNPHFFQVSLEGLPEHNDNIRGPGHFNRVMEFLDLLHDLDVYSMVMLTLTKDNIDQVIPLARLLNRKTDSFYFNRLSMVGEGANLRLPTPEKYRSFLQEYMDAAENNPVMCLKDNLFNIIKQKKGEPLFSGCTGYGCGAAFNFMAILSDGEVHACRKFPSPVGNIFSSSFSKIYESDASRKYREGCDECRSCKIRPVCGGCLAISHSFGLDIFTEKDPHCFTDKNSLLGW